VTPYLLVDGARVTPENIEKPRLRFRLRFPASEIRLVSGAASPAELEGSQDTRPLGVLLRGLRWTQNEAVIDVPVDSPSFIDGFHVVETHTPGDGPVRWTTGNAALPPALFPPWQGEVLLHLSLGEWRGSAHEPPISGEAALLSGFESLGEDCEFGLVQRRYLVEPPLSLFRWAGTPVERLIQGLDNGFSGLAEPENTDLVWNGTEYFLRTPFVTMHTQCLVEQDAAGIEEVLHCGRATLRVLRRKLLKDIAAANRIFVFKSLDPAFSKNQMHQLHTAMRRIGPVCLLCVKVARPGQPIGHAERLADGLYSGYVDGSVIQSGPFEQWLSMCAETKALYRRS
jgi:hypothetical protein